MKIFRNIAIVSFLSTGLSFAEKFVLDEKSHTPKAGTIHLIEESHIVESLDMVVTVQGNKMKGSVATTGLKQEKLEFVSDTKMNYTVVKSKSTEKSVMNGQAAPVKEKQNDLLGVTVNFEKKADKWDISNLNDLNEKQKTEAVQYQANLNQLLSLYGYNERAIGEEWEIDEDTLMDFLSEGNEGIKKASGKLKLISVKTKDGNRIATLHMTFDASGVAGGANMSLQAEKIIITRDIDLFVDLDVKGDTSLQMDMTNQNMDIKGSGVMQMSVMTTIK